eukprot:CAMPEP_0185208316 /NCGR_PEP_ID=MMETSP1140-20130426/61865_1 /TAXON_ID=298111 /ORGANISM="Pavlova sp., Strain CCMP459" /LENGTH=60 /DNA_ID=CAMNT_0027776033 /DNA_START=1 /DNA_END=183 /DNA_ORIENTATION=-
MQSFSRHVGRNPRGARSELSHRNMPSVVARVLHMNRRVHAVITPGLGVHAHALEGRVVVG